MYIDGIERKGVGQVDRVEKGLREIAEDLWKRGDGTYTVDDYYEMVRATYESMRRHHGEAFAQFSNETILAVIRKQMNELSRFRNVEKLMKKRHHI
ncbi:hypothetical protein DNHGIG_06330 [Collibacillus ludicampi]|uniref:Uncharacterized protein n=1 Tax=Collibacillus ludicampi TaxID=2771369 RepID=A0AAV4LBK7_9BACL|nr:hypothetical protein [Collibacillus ludicampi]GIM45084.1 hypothetical protein DNHGIG_06330 [Collibacillus ludicampi]